MFSLTPYDILRQNQDFNRGGETNDNNRKKPSAAARPDNRNRPLRDCGLLQRVGRGSAAFTGCQCADRPDLFQAGRSCAGRRGEPLVLQRDGPGPERKAGVFRSDTAPVKPLHKPEGLGSECQRYRSFGVCHREGSRGIVPGHHHGRGGYLP